MDCTKCSNKAVINLQHGALCKLHFLNYFEDKVFKTIKKHQLIRRNEKVCVATSGGKDSLAVLYLTKKYLEKFNVESSLFALVIDEGIEGYRETTINDLEDFCKRYKIKLEKVSSKEEFGYSLDEAYPIINKKTKKKPCNICGVWRRYLLNKYAKKLKAKKVITGHNLDDEAQSIMMNHMKANTKLAAHLGPISGVEENEMFVQRVKPLYFCTEKETRLYCLLKGFKVDFTECPFASEGLRHDVQEMLNDFENKYPGTKQGVVSSFLAVLPLLKVNQSEKEPLKECLKCSEPANQDVCNACKLKGVLNGEI